MATAPGPERRALEARDLATLGAEIRRVGAELGFAALGVAGIDLADDEAHLERWLAAGRHGELEYMARHGRKRSRPAELVPGTLRVISARMDYWPGDACADAEAVLKDPTRGYVSRYALGRDYHKVLRHRLQRLASDIEARIGPFGYRVFTDSAPVLEKALARNAGLGWIGKHTNLIARGAGSWFFLGEIFTDLPLPIDAPASAHCGSCTACLDVCPTDAIVAPYELDARRCISYLTIEQKGAIPEPLRPKIGNRIFGCDDCQLFCPWNKFARRTEIRDFAPRHGLDSGSLIELFAWTEPEWASRTEGSAIRRAGYEGWLRNVAVALGNAPTEPAIVAALEARRDDPSPLVREHVRWALGRHGQARTHPRAERAAAQAGPTLAERADPHAERAETHAGRADTRAS
ncbi:MAG TPA: tRNA epoxyqueuosine(34) reductase QueG [Gammaproteobacteria bacterium]|nr:tRNA epoxyqueuosine(34) reductase QueG [Gammaproteobacteria bacterium]